MALTIKRYKEPTARIMVNGAFSTFSKSQVTRKGNPLPPLIFAWCIKPLAECYWERGENKRY